jgi:hypothetical protein
VEKITTEDFGLHGVGSDWNHSKMALDGEVSWFIRVKLWRNIKVASGMADDVMMCLLWKYLDPIDEH